MARATGQPRSKAQRPSKDDLETIPGIGPAMAQDLRDLGVRSVAGLCRRDPETMYRRLIQIRGEHQDRCVLYVFRCAVYYASTRRPDPARLLWWNWSDDALRSTRPKHSP